jgi:hypothetical protein
LHRVVGAKDERHGVEEEDGRLGLVRHETSLAVTSSQRSLFRSPGPRIETWGTQLGLLGEMEPGPGEPRPRQSDVGCQIAVSSILMCLCRNSPTLRPLKM